MVTAVRPLELGGIAMVASTSTENHEDRSTAFAVTFFTGLIAAGTVFVCSLVAAFFSLRWAAIAYVAAIYLAFVIMMIAAYGVRPADLTWPQRLILVPEAEKIFRKHFVFFKFPFGARNLTHFLKFARMFGLLWAIVALWQLWFVTSGLLGLFFFW